MTSCTASDSPPTTPVTPLWVAIPDSVLFDPELRATDVRVYAVLKRYALRFGNARVRPSQEHIAINADCHRASLSESLAILEERGHIARAPGGFGETDRITILDPTARSWGFHPSPQPRLSRKQPRRRNPPQTPQLSQKPTSRKSRQLVSQKTTTGVAICDTNKDVEKRDEEERDERRVDGAANEETTGGKLTSLPASANPSHTAWAAFCQAAHLDISAATRQEQDKSLAIARRLLNDGVSLSEIAACARYLKSQQWRTTPLSLNSVAAEVGRWRMAGRPAQEPSPPRTTYRSQADINAPTGQLVL